VLLVALSFTFIIFFKSQRIVVKTSTMAAVMAFGIMTQGVLINYFGTGIISGVGKLLCILNLSLWFAFLFSFITTVRDRQFRMIHYNNPLNRFGIGTWVAGTSVCSILVIRHFPELSVFVKCITFLNLALWFTYIVISVFALKEIARSQMTKAVNGILLLTTVSTQSVVLLLNSVYKNEIPVFINISLLLIGIGFYLICIGVIATCQLRDFKNFEIEIDWKNTNCILHGAVSITGLACIFSSVGNEPFIRLLWIIAACIFIFVESVEIYRLYKRVKKFGISMGVFVYDVSQWSRVFTFGMFYAFTFRSLAEAGVLSQIQSLVIQTGVWVILFLITVEVILCFKTILENYSVSSSKVEEISG
jgi:hypothetical protein